MEWEPYQSQVAFRWHANDVIHVHVNLRVFINRYWITDPEWTKYTRLMSRVYCAAFTSVDIRILFNLENPGVDAHDDPWILEQCPGALIKQGIVSHGYQLNGELDLYNNWYALGLDKAYSRGELAVEPDPANGTYLHAVCLLARSSTPGMYFT